MGVLVRYKNKAIMTYSLNCYMPWEGFQVNLNGSKGRIEMKVVEKSYVNSGGKKEDEGALQTKSIKVIPMFGEAYEAEIVEGAGGHGGGDPVMLNDIFGVLEAEDPFKRAASHIDGAMSILTGIAGSRSMSTGLPVNVDDLVKF